MRRSARLHDAIDRRGHSLRLKSFLQLAFRIATVEQIGCGERLTYGLTHERARGVEAERFINCSDDRFDGVGQNIRLIAFAARACAASPQAPPLGM